VHFHIGNNAQPNSLSKGFTDLFGEQGEQNVGHGMEPMAMHITEEMGIIQFDVMPSQRFSGDDC
jgi:hypothetical protein